jgi:hypothetical protein
MKRKIKTIQGMGNLDNRLSARKYTKSSIDPRIKIRLNT